jgi:hypothetical protein
MVIRLQHKLINHQRYWIILPVSKAVSVLLDVYVISTYPFNHIHGSTSNLGRKGTSISAPRFQHTMDETKERE